MGQVRMTGVAQQIGTLFEAGSAVGLSDRQLLDRFHSSRDAGGEAAFAALVTRHGPMVLRFAGSSSMTSTSPRMPFRPRSWSWPGSHARSGIATGWAIGFMVSPPGPRRAARARLARQRQREEAGTMLPPSPIAVPEPSQGPAEEAFMAREDLKACTARSSDCRTGSVSRSCCATSKALTVQETRSSSVGRTAPSAAAWPGAAKSCGERSVRRGFVVPPCALLAVLESQPASASGSPALYCARVSGCLPLCRRSDRCHQRPFGFRQSPWPKMC